MPSADNKLIAKNSLILYIKLFVVSITGLLFSRYILEALGAEDFGIYVVIGGIVTLISFLNSAMAASTRRFIAYEYGRQDQQNLNKIFNISLLIHVIIALFVLIIVETAGAFFVTNYLNVDKDRISDALFVLHFSALSIMFYIMSVPYEGLITAKEDFLTISILDVTKKLLTLAIAISLLFYEGNRLQLFSVLIAVLAVMRFITLFFFSRLNYPSITKFLFVSDLSQYKSMVKFSGWIMFGVAARAGEHQGSAIMINLFFGPVLNASYGIAEKMNQIVRKFADGIIYAVIPQITKSYSGGKTDRTIQLVQYSSKYAYFLLFLPVIPILLETSFLLSIWLKKVPEYTEVFVKLILIKGLIIGASSGIPPAIHATGKIKLFQIIVNGISILGLPIVYLLFFRGYPPYFLLYTYIIIEIIKLITRQILLKRHLQFDVNEFFKKAYLKMIVVTLAALPLFVLINIFEPGLLRFISFVFFSILWNLTAIFMLGLENPEKKMISNYIRTRVIGAG